MTDADVKPKRTRGEYKGFRYRERNGRPQVEVRLKKLPKPLYFTFEKGTKKAEAIEIVKERLRDEQSANVPTLENKSLSKYSVGDIITAWRTNPKLHKLRTKNASWRNEDGMIVSFQKREKTICAMTLNEDRKINLAIRTMIERLKQSYEVEYTITRINSPIRTIFAHLSEIMFAIEGRLIDIRNPMLGIKWPKDKQASEGGRERVLFPGDELKIFQAIIEGSASHVYRLKWITLIQLAISTCLRRGVLLNLKWKDIEWDNQLIRISRTYWRGRKKAPPMVPLTKIMTECLKAYYEDLPEGDKQPNDLIFSPDYRRPNRSKRTTEDVELDDPNGWANQAFTRFIKRTDLWEEDDKGEKDYIHFHDLRHTATTRFAEPPYSMGQQEYEYLKGNKIKYNHPQHMEITSRIRGCIEKGDKINYGTLENPALLAIKAVKRAKEGKGSYILTPAIYKKLAALNNAAKERLAKEGYLPTETITIEPPIS